MPSRKPRAAEQLRVAFICDMMGERGKRFCNEFRRFLRQRGESDCFDLSVGFTRQQGWPEGTENWHHVVVFSPHAKRELEDHLNKAHASTMVHFLKPEFGLVRGNWQGRLLENIKTAEVLRKPARDAH